MWELPQNVLGLVVFLVAGGCKRRRYEWEHKRLYIRTNFGVSLGMFVFYLETQKGNKYHEYGHAIQSMILGPLYLFVVGIPTVLRVCYGYCYYRIYRRSWTGYYMGFPEKWADQLGRWQRFQI